MPDGLHCLNGSGCLLFKPDFTAESVILSHLIVHLEHNKDPEVCQIINTVMSRSITDLETKTKY